MIALGLIGSFVGVGWYAETHPSQRNASAAASTPAHDPIEAWTICQEFLGDRLLAPRTAKYPWRSVTEFVTYQGADTYKAVNYVDSQNANGVMVRTHFTCRVTKEPTRWRLDSLEFK